jgi:hypothetical protein
VLPGIESLRLADGQRGIAPCAYRPSLTAHAPELERANYSAFSVEVIDPFSNRIRFDENP